MIYILSGNDLTAKNSYIKKIVGNKDRLFLTGESLNKDSLLNYASGNVLFGELPVILTEDIVKNGEINFSENELKDLKNSQTVFILIEDKLLKADEKKFKKYATFEKFTTKEEKPRANNNVFDIANAFARKDKFGAWMFYSRAIEEGVTPEAIAGMLFWKIKTMILNNNKTFPLDILKYQSSRLISLYHLAHMGKANFTIGLEQFILDSLS